MSFGAVISSLAFSASAFDVDVFRFRFIEVAVSNNGYGWQQGRNYNIMVQRSYQTTVSELSTTYARKQFICDHKTTGKNVRKINK